MMVAQGGFDKKEEVENPSEVLLNPSDPEATFRYKAGGRHLGYVGNVVEAVGEKSSLVIVYDYQQNTYADNQFMKDYLNEKKDFSDGSFIVADGAYSGEENSRLASEHNLKLVTTNFTGHLNEKLNSGFGPNARVKGVRTFSWTKLLFLDYVYTQVGSFHQVTF